MCCSRSHGGCTRHSRLGLGGERLEDRLCATAHRRPPAHAADSTPRVAASGLRTTERHALRSDNTTQRCFARCVPAEQCLTHRLLHVRRRRPTTHRRTPGTAADHCLRLLEEEESSSRNIDFERTKPPTACRRDATKARVRHRRHTCTESCEPIAQAHACTHRTARTCAY